MQERLPTAPGDDPSREGQDEIDASKAPLLDHLIELRERLIWALGAFVVMFFLCFSVAGHIYNVLVWPYMWASGNDHVKLIATHFLEQIMTQVKLAMFGAAFLPYLIATPVLFVIGAMMVYFVAMPVLIRFSIGLTHMSGEGVPEIELLPKVSEYLSLIMTLIFGFGIVFQLPVVLTLLARTGLVSSETLAHGRRYAVVAIFAAAALLTPPDALSMCIMALPTIGLYEVSILAVRFVERQQAKARAAND
jgi:sec-independent protein translocase protein TatC